MATEVQKILTENSAATRLRGSRVFTTPGHKDNRNVLSALHKLTTARLGGDPPALTFLPFFYGEDRSEPLEHLSFRDWWNRDIIYRASAAVPGTPPGFIPVNDSPSVPFDEREKVTRRQLVELLRNKLGAHQTPEMPRLLDELQESRNWAGFAIQTPQGLLSTEDGSLAVTVSPMPPMMRQIAHELLEAYGRHDPAPAPPQESAT